MKMIVNFVKKVKYEKDSTVIIKGRR